MGYILGVDGGGSKTLCLAADTEGRLIGHGRGGSINTNYVRRREALQSLREAVEKSLTGSGLTGEEINLLCMSAPIDPESVETVIREFGIRKIIRAPEGETPRWAARFWVERHVGVTVDAGTGAMARGWTKDGGQAGAGGWGATLGDEGSSYWIGIEAMRGILRAFDGRTKPTLLTEPVLNHLGFTDMLDMVFKVDQALVREPETKSQIRVAPDSGAETSQALGGVYFRQESATRAPLSRFEIASLCPIVAKVASWGDWKAKEIFWTAGRELGQAGVAVIKRLQMEQDDFAVIPFGGVFKSGELVLGAFENTIRAAAPRASVIKPRFEPAVGAVLLALDAMEVEIDPFVLKNLERTSSRFAAARLDYLRQEGALNDSH